MKNAFIFISDLLLVTILQVRHFLFVTFPDFSSFLSLLESSSWSMALPKEFGATDLIHSEISFVKEGLPATLLSGA